MRSILLLLLLSGSIVVYGQRFITDEYPVLDSLIGGVYGEAIDYQSNSQDLLFDFYEPANDTLAKRPLLIYMHGGGFTSGSRTYPSVQMLSRRMASKGYAVANIDYRLDPRFELYNSNTDRRAMTDAMHDAKQAIRYFKTNANTYRIDTSLVFIGGESAGAMTAMMASFIDKPAEMESYPMAEPNDPVGSSANPQVWNGVKGTLCLCGWLLDTLAIEQPSDPAILWAHGTDDDFIPIELAFSVVLRAVHVGLPIQTKVYEGGVHCPWYFGNPNWETYLDSTVMEITNFLYPLVNDAVVSTAEVGLGTGVSIYPNPFASRLHIDLPTTGFKTRLAVFSAFGRLLQETYSRPTENSITIDLTGVSPGVYFVLLQNESGKAVRKVVKGR